MIPFSNAIGLAGVVCSLHGGNPSGTVFLETEKTPLFQQLLTGRLGARHPEMAFSDVKPLYISWNISEKNLSAFYEDLTVEMESLKCFGASSEELAAAGSNQKELREALLEYAVTAPEIREESTSWLAQMGFVFKPSFRLCYGDTTPFHELHIGEDDRKKITRIIHTMGNNNIIKLGLKSRELEKLGREVHHVHPLRFLWHVFSNPQLKEDMQEVRKSSFKWRGFIDKGYSRKMDAEAKINNLDRYVPGFAESLGVEEDRVFSYIHAHDWEGLVHYLLN